MTGHLRLLAQALVETLEQSSPTREHDPSVHDVRGELGWSTVERLLHRLDDLRERLLECLTDLPAGESAGLGQARPHVASANLSLKLLLHRACRADLQLELLGGLLTDQKLVLALCVVDDRLVHLIAPHADRLR